MVPLLIVVFATFVPSLFFKLRYISVLQEFVRRNVKGILEQSVANTFSGDSETKHTVTC